MLKISRVCDLRVGKYSSPNFVQIFSCNPLYHYKCCLRWVQFASLCQTTQSSNHQQRLNLSFVATTALLLIVLRQLETLTPKLEQRRTAVLCESTRSLLNSRRRQQGTPDPGPTSTEVSRDERLPPAQQANCGPGYMSRQIRKFSTDKFDT